MKPVTPKPLNERAPDLITLFTTNPYLSLIFNAEVFK